MRNNFVSTRGAYYSEYGTNLSGMSQIVQEYGSSPVRVLVCALRWGDCVNFLLPTLHEYGFSHVCVLILQYVNWADWEWFLTCMCSGAPTEVARLCKPLLTHVTGIWFPSCVSSHVVIYITCEFCITHLLYVLSCDIWGWQLARISYHKHSMKVVFLLCVCSWMWHLRLSASMNFLWHTRIWFLSCMCSNVNN